MESEINVMIVDDEQEAVDLLAILLKESFSNISIVATANSSDDAIKKAYRKHPDLIFLDIEIDKKNGFDIIEKLKQENHLPHIIFVTAYNKYAHDAFKTNAIDYLLKPIDAEDLKAAIQKFEHTKSTENQIAQIRDVLNQFPQKIRFNTRTGFILLNTSEIIYCKADRNYTKIFIAIDQFQLVSMNLASVEKKLPGFMFWRISRSLVVNSGFVSQIERKQKVCTLIFSQQKIELPASAEMLKQL